MSDLLYSADTAVFRSINHGLSHPWLDTFFAGITDWSPVYPFLGVLMVVGAIWGGAKARWAVAGVLLAVLLADQLSAHVLKDWVCRIRPCNALDNVINPIGKRSTYSFPSSHATNMGATMLFLALTYRRLAAVFLTLGFLVGLSRIYLGLHYPSDVLGGFTLGMLIGYGLWWSIERIKARVHGPKPAPVEAQVDVQGA